MVMLRNTCQATTGKWWPGGRVAETGSGIRNRVQILSESGSSYSWNRRAVERATVGIAEWWNGGLFGIRRWLVSDTSGKRRMSITLGSESGWFQIHSGSENGGFQILLDLRESGWSKMHSGSENGGFQIPWD
ncbi:hypothetical protein AVEN_133966-1 [Araneus ventricosus]|uniref:Uncharacterized protein n=1 Tax=Araneus ventricosus TaxID=182803 RepID=A0A4Y2J891_ARAVE|nr:hypothetical protein AVEN_133966-1 [Araneus ventricosus]